MSDGINAGNPLGRPRTREELLSALEEAQQFGQHRTQEVVDLSAEVARLRAEVERLTREREESIMEREAHPFFYCPNCESCGVGGCCKHYCAFCKSRHDSPGEATEVFPDKVFAQARAERDAALRRVEEARRWLEVAETFIPEWASEKKPIRAWLAAGTKAQEGTEP